MNDPFSDVVDVEARIVSVQTIEEKHPSSTAIQVAAEKMVATAVVPLDKSLVAPFEAKTEIAKADVAIAAARAVVKEVEDAKVDEIDVSTEDGEKKVRALLKRVVKQRTGTQAAYEAWNRPLLDAQKGVRAVVKQVETIVQPAEDKLAAIVAEIDNARELARQREIEREQARIKALREKVTSIPSILPSAVSMTSAQVETELRTLQDIVITSDETSYGEFSDEAAALRASTVGQLLEMFNAKKAAEDERVRLDAERVAAQERERAAEIERGLRQRIAGLQQLAFSAMGKSAADIKAILDELVAKEPLALEFGDLHKEAANTWGMAKVMLENAYAGQKRMEDQQAENERVAREQAAERQALEVARAEAEASEKAKRAAALAEVSRLGQEIEAEEFQLKPSDAPFQVPAGPAAEEALETALAELCPLHDTASEKAMAMEASRQEVAETLLELASGAECTKDVVEEPVIDAEIYDGQTATEARQLLEPVMSMCADRAGYEEARALFLAAKITTNGTAHEVAMAVVDSLNFADFPLPEVGELAIVSLLLHPEVRGALRIWQESLINAKA